MRRLTMACWALAVVGCAATPALTVPDIRGARHASLTAMLAAHPLLQGQNISAVLLGHTEALSYHLVQIRDREQPHMHATHDLAVTLLRGAGRLYIRGEAYDMRAGDVAVVPRGTPHYFVNSDSTPATAFVTFAPPYDGTDQVPTE